MPANEGIYLGSNGSPAWARNNTTASSVGARVATQVKPEAIAGIRLTDPDGSPAVLGEFAAEPLAVVLVRYFGCLPCQHYLSDLDDVAGDLPAGSRVIAVGGSSPAQARWLRDTKDVQIPLMLDPAQRVRSVVQLGTLSMRQLSSGRGWRNYARAMRNGFRPQIPTQHMNQAPGIALFDEGFAIEWVHRGEMMGDYPPLGDLVERIRSISAKQ